MAEQLGTGYYNTPYKFNDFGVKSERALNERSARSAELDEEVELIYQHKFTTIEQAKLAVFEYIEVWYNRKRLHSSLSYKTPKEMELAFYKIKSVA